MEVALATVVHTCARPLQAGQFKHNNKQLSDSYLSKMLNIMCEFCVGKCLMRMLQTGYFSCPPSTCIIRVILSPRNKIRPADNRREKLQHTALRLNYKTRTSELSPILKISLY